MKKCEICGINKAEVPDRDRPGRPIKRICRTCHAERLRKDWVRAVNIKKNKAHRYYL